LHEKPTKIATPPRSLGVKGQISFPSILNTTPFGDRKSSIINRQSQIPITHYLIPDPFFFLPKLEHLYYNPNMSLPLASSPLAETASSRHVPSQRQAGIGRFDDMNRRTRLYRAHERPMPVRHPRRRRRSPLAETAFAKHPRGTSRHVPSQRQAGIGRFDDMNRRTRLYRAHCEAHRTRRVSPWDERPIVEPYVPVEASFTWTKWKKYQSENHVLGGVPAAGSCGAMVRSSELEERLIPFEFSPPQSSVVNLQSPIPYP
jgi:hypothetical protein